MGVDHTKLMGLAFLQAAGKLLSAADERYPRYTHTHIHTHTHTHIKVKVKQSSYRHGVAQRVPGS